MIQTDLLIITHIPTFYKINLYNEIAIKKQIFVIFLSNSTNEFRSIDFIDTRFIKFPFLIINKLGLSKFNLIDSYKLIFYLIYKIRYKKIIVGGWDLIAFWLIIFICKKSNNILNLESTIIESKAIGVKKFLKKLFLLRITYIITPGMLNLDLLNKLNYRGKIIISNGVGIINKFDLNYSLCNKKYQKKFLFIGRLCESKNLFFLIESFRLRPSFNLTIVGDGPLLKKLNEDCPKNVKLVGSCCNSAISKIFSNHNFLILPSINEPWGLVIDESLYHNVPVIVSKNCGGSVQIQNDINGWIFDPSDMTHFISIIDSINEDSYLRLLNSFFNYNYKFNDKVQVYSYLNIS
jgi:glycosyltransferase involved in cell wall biosynthesis